MTNMLYHLYASLKVIQRAHGLGGLDRLIVTTLLLSAPAAPCASEVGSRHSSAAVG